MRKLSSTAFAVVILLFAIGVGRLSAGSPDAPGDPNSIGAQMVSLEAIYQRLDTGAAGTVATAFQEPSTSPISGTMHNLNQIMSQAPVLDSTNGATRANVVSGKTFWGLTSGQWGPQTGTAPAAGVAKTGQTNCYNSAGLASSCNGVEDGALQRGVTPPNPRFVVAGPGAIEGVGTVTDKLTGLIWLRDADCFGQVTWFQAINLTIQINNGNNCGTVFNQLNEGNWRVPNLKELQSLIDYGHVNPALPSGYSSFFNNVPAAGRYWSSTTVENTGQTANGWEIDFAVGTVNRNQPKTTSANYHVWPVRGPQ